MEGRLGGGAGAGVKDEPTEQLLYWLTRWSGRNHALGEKVSMASVEGRVGLGQGVKYR